MVTKPVGTCPGGDMSGGHLSRGGDECPPFVFVVFRIFLTISHFRQGALIKTTHRWTFIKLWEGEDVGARNDCFYFGRSVEENIYFSLNVFSHVKGFYWKCQPVSGNVAHCTTLHLLFWFSYLAVVCALGVLSDIDSWVVASTSRNIP